jgi:phosphoribosylamine--glycine ligase
MTLPIMPTRILIVGSGGREHALAWKLAGEPGVNRVIVAPGSDAIADVERVVCAREVGAVDAEALVALARAEAVELVVIGPEAPLAAGVADALRAAGVPTFGPGAEAARIETSKAFCREIANAADVPMARGRAFAQTDPAAAMAYAIGLGAKRGGVVVKADGLAAGKGVTVCETADEAAQAISGQPGDIVVEERLSGPEASVIALCDGRTALALPAARDHKRLLDGDRGPNTGGMGAYSPLPDLPDDAVADLVERFHVPVLAELARRGTPFVGALYAGLMLTADGPRLLEFNARFGDPETQVLLPRLAVALGPLLLAAAHRRLTGQRQRFGGAVLPATRQAAVAIVLAAEGYPTRPRTGDVIRGRDEVAPDILVFEAGTRRDVDGTWRTNGGRVLAVVGPGADLAAARQSAETAADTITFDGAQRRHDIGVPLAAHIQAVVGATA